MSKTDNELVSSMDGFTELSSKTRHRTRKNFITFYVTILKVDSYATNNSLLLRRMSWRLQILGGGIRSIEMNLPETKGKYLQ
jgi:hypothetical protein